MPLDQLARIAAISWSAAFRRNRIFTASLADNVSLFQPVPHERIRQALRLSSLEEWVTCQRDSIPAWEQMEYRFPMASAIGWGLARAIIQNRPIVLMDEPTAGLDEATDSRFCWPLLYALPSSDYDSGLTLAGSHGLGLTIRLNSAAQRRSNYEPVFTPAPYWRLQQEQICWLLCWPVFCPQAGIGLMGTAAWLISKAALQPPLYALTLGITMGSACGTGIIPLSGSLVLP